MELLKYIKNKLRRLFLRGKILLFGQSFFEDELEDLSYKVEVQEAKLHLLTKALLELDKKQNKKEWNSTIENAIHGLNEKAEMLATAVNHQQGAIEHLKQEQRTYSAGGTKTTIKTVN